MLFYVAIKYKKDSDVSEAPEYDEDMSETDSGMGESGQSRNGESPDLDEEQHHHHEELDSQMIVSESGHSRPPDLDLHHQHHHHKELDSQMIVTESGHSRSQMTVKDKRLSDIDYTMSSSPPSSLIRKEVIRLKSSPSQLIKTPALSDEKKAKLLQREEIKKRYTILRRKTRGRRLEASRSVKEASRSVKEASRSVKGEEGLKKVTKPMWLIPGQNSFHVNIHPSFSSQQPKCYSFQCKPRVRREK